MSALIEVHTLEELDRVLELRGVNLVGINNRNLEDFSVNLQTTCSILAARADAIRERGILIVSESGLHTPADLHRVAESGAQAVLIGESLVKSSEPVGTFASEKERMHSKIATLFAPQDP
jgi:indole-3-glycerol phosphate synthase